MRNYAQVKSVKAREISLSLFMNEVGSNHLHPYKTLTSEIQWLLDKMHPRENSGTGMSKEANVLLVGIPLISRTKELRKLLRVLLTKVEPTYTMWGEDGWPLRATVEITLKEYVPSPV